MVKQNELKMTKGDYAQGIVKAAISTIPLVGGPAAEIFSLVLEAPITKRRDEFLTSLMEELVKMDEKVENFQLDKLSENENFVTALMHALPIAIKNHQLEKITALRNVVLNSTLPNAPDEDKQLMFLNLIDSFTPWHLKILILLNDPEQYAEKNHIKFPNWANGAVSYMIEYIFPELEEKEEFNKQIWNDLYNHGLLNTSGGMFNTTMTGHGMIQSRTTSLGKEFIDFIKEPKY